MNAFRPLSRAALFATLALLPAACAQQPGQPSPQTVSAPAQGSGMPGMSGMSGMKGMDHSAMMAQCKDMHGQMAQGTHANSPGMTETMRHCEMMDHDMGSMPGMGATAPAATRSR